jgi:hypothetical protein
MTYYLYLVWSRPSAGVTAPKSGEKTKPWDLAIAETTDERRPVTLYKVCTISDNELLCT